MKLAPLIAPLILAAFSPNVAPTVALGQTPPAPAGSSPSSSGVSSRDIQESFRTATDVVAADVLSNSFSDTGSEIRVRSRLVAKRVLSGGLRPEEEFDLDWSFRPSPGETIGAAGTEAPPSGLLMMRKQGGRFDLLIASMNTGLWGKFVPASSAPPAGPFAYTAGQPLQTKMGCEIGAAVQDIVAQHAGDLDVSVPQNPAPTPVRPGPVALPTQAAIVRGKFSALLEALGSLDSASAAPVYRYMSAQSDANLKLAGIAGRLAGRDHSALFDLERDLPRLAMTWAAHQMPVMRQLGFIDVGADLPAAHALARIALSETTIPSIEGAMARTLASTHSPEVLPYFMLLLNGPTEGIRDNALFSMCHQLLRPAPGSTVQQFWKPEMDAECPEHSPLNDPDREKQYLDYWNDWWAANREAIARVAQLPVVTPPARWTVQASSLRAVSAATLLEMRFGALVTRDTVLRSHGLPAPPEPFLAQFSSHDAQVYREVIDATSKRYDEQRQKINQLQQEARVQGVRPDSSQAPRQADIFKAGLDELRNRLSPAGWQALERYLNTM